MATKTVHKKPHSNLPARKKHLSMMATKATKKRKHPRKKSKGMLSEMVSQERAMTTGKAVLSGAVGGGFARIIDDKLVPAAWGNGARLLTGAVASFVVGAIFGMPNVSAGMAGGFGYAMVEKKMLADNSDDDDLDEDGEFTDADILEEMPMYLDERGDVLMEDANGNLYSLADKQPMYYSPYNRQA